MTYNRYHELNQLLLFEECTSFYSQQTKLPRHFWPGAQVMTIRT